MAAVVLSIDNPIAAVLFGSGSELPRVIRLILFLPFFLPMWAVGARRLHDIGKSGWWQLIFLTGIGTIVLYVWYATETDPKGDRFNSSDTPGQELPESAEQKTLNTIEVYFLALMVVILVVGTVALITGQKTKPTVTDQEFDKFKSLIPGANEGYVRIYRNIDDTWIQIGQDIEGEADEDDPRTAVALSSDGSVVAIGARFNDGDLVVGGYAVVGEDSGHVRLFRNVDDTWTQIGQDIDGEATFDYSGESVALSFDGSVVAIGAKKNDGNGNISGHVRIYRNVDDTWTKIGQDINGEAARDFSGEAVALSSDGSVVAIGAPWNDDNGEESGHVRLFRNVDDTWTQIGQDIDGEAANDYSGAPVALSSDGSVVAIGAPMNEDNGYYAGHVRIYHNMDDTWTQIGQDIDGAAAGDRFGESVALSSDGSVVAIGASWNDDNGEESGHVRIYHNVDNTWTQIGQDIDGEAADDFLGTSVALSSDGSVVAIGAMGNDGNGEDSGHVRLYRNVNGTWTQIGQEIVGEAAGDESGLSIDLSSDGSVVAIGAMRIDLD